MKKRSILMILCMLLLSLVLLAGCGSAKYADSEYLGEWKLSTASVEGFEANMSDMVGKFSFMCEDTGKATFVSEGQEQSCKWEPTDKGLSIIAGDDTLELVKQEDGRLMLQYSEFKLFFEKAK